MKEVLEDWERAYSNKQLLEVFAEIRDIDIFEHGIAALLSRNFRMGDLVLEAGCGTGKFCFWLGSKGINCIGIDIVPDAVQLASDFSIRQSFQLRFIVGDVTMLPFRNSCLDGYLSFGVIEHFRSIVEVLSALREAKRVLKPGGKLFLTVPNEFTSIRNKVLLALSKGRIGMYHAAFTKAKVERMAKSTGLRIIELRTSDQWMPVYNLIDGIASRLFHVRNRTSLRFYFSTALKRLFRIIPSNMDYLGIIYLLAEKNA